MKVFYTSRDYRDWAERLERELTSALSPDAIKEKLAHLDTLMAAADGPYAQSEDSKDVLAALLALDESQQPLFEPLILALRAFRDRSVLYQIAREKRDLVLDVMARISGTTNSPAS